jgi:hypothetical protein
VEALPESDEKNRLRGSLVAAGAGKDPRRAIEEAGKLAGDAQVNAFQRIASIWAYREPEEAMKWVVGVPANTNPFLMTTVLRTWVSQDPGEVATWIQKQPAGVTRDNATAEFATLVVADDPEAAMEWAKTIADERRRQNAQRNCLQRWKQDDPERMKAWLTTNSDVAPSVREQLLQEPRPSGSMGSPVPIPGLR